MSNIKSKLLQNKTHIVVLIAATMSNPGFETALIFMSAVTWLALLDK